MKSLVPSRALKKPKILEQRAHAFVHLLENHSENNTGHLEWGPICAG